ncbi:Zn-dependent exopeptidase [Lentinula boryana]|uniref:Zn-dependent exopeptidase n=1 Tax=Lentinula boryana TaxID=40481 RepID=A0ABQ8QHI1_9AGAR|nr:Zn-dependent exopeptidase [Lentinula boryana]
MDPEDQLISPKHPSLLWRRPEKRLTTRKFLTRLACLLVIIYGLRYLATIHFNFENGSVVSLQESWISSPTFTSSMPTKVKEQLFLSVPNTGNATATAKQYSKHPHLAGSSEDYHDALTVLEFLQTELGIAPRPPSHQPPIYNAGTPKSRAQTIALTSRLGPRSPQAWIDVYYPYLNTPLDRSLDIVDETGKSIWSADLREDGNEGDADAAKYRDYIPPWHGLSANGEGQGRLVYVNYGTYEDYEEVLASGQNFSGKVVIARYGALFRGLKIKRAEDLGAAAILIYSDPRDDGFVTVENGFAPYPDGPARNPTSVQRGSAMYLSLYPGDPTTPGKPAYDKAEREEGKNVPRIPSLPISWMNAERLLKEIVDNKVTPIWNTMAAIPGHVRDEVVIVGCHRDAWVLGAADPVSGTISLLEIVRGLGTLLRNGWKPLRTILIASWDAEEYGLVGSTEYGEDFAEWISEHAVAYLNVDVSSAGSKWDAVGSPSLAHLIRKTAMDVSHPSGEEGKTLWDAREDEGPFKPFGPVRPDGKPGLVVYTNSSDAQGLNTTISSHRILEIGNIHADADVMEAYEASRNERLSKEEGRDGTSIGPMGSGSDFTVFLQRLGVASSDQGFAGTPYDAPYHYHSIYDSMRWQEVYADPGYKKHLAIAQHLGLLVLRLTDSIIVPLNTTQYALELDGYLDRVESLLPSLDAEGGISNVRVAFSTLRQHISQLQETSVLLDIEKIEAEELFEELLSRMPSFPGSLSTCRHQNTLTYRFKEWVKRIFGVQHHRRDAFAVDSWESLLSSYDSDEQEDKAIAGWLEHRLYMLTGLHGPGLPSPPPILDFIRAAKRVSRVNHKLFFFERGFIDEGGIKNREWYRHLGVAPGKWLGYGATTFPALTEAIVIEKNMTEAVLESGRLVELLKGMIENLKV